MSAWLDALTAGVSSAAALSPAGYLWLQHSRNRKERRARERKQNPWLQHRALDWQRALVLAHYARCSGLDPVVNPTSAPEEPEPLVTEAPDPEPVDTFWFDVVGIPLDVWCSAGRCYGPSGFSFAPGVVADLVRRREAGEFSKQPLPAQSLSRQAFRNQSNHQDKYEQYRVMLKRAVDDRMLVQRYADEQRAKAEEAHQRRVKALALRDMAELVGMPMLALEASPPVLDAQQLEREEADHEREVQHIEELLTTWGAYRSLEEDKQRSLEAHRQQLAQMAAQGYLIEDWVNIYATLYRQHRRSADYRRLLQEEMAAIRACYVHPPEWYVDDNLWNVLL